jgi:hypothetical protein
MVSPPLNTAPFWLTWLTAFPGYPRRRRTLWELFYLHKRRIFFLSSSLITWGLVAFFPASFYLLWYLFTRLHLEAFPALVLAGISGLLLPVVPPVVFYLLTLLVNTRRQRLARWRKSLAAFLSVRYQLAPGGLGLLLEDDDRLALLLQRFLAEHQVPYALPLYDSAGRYQFAAPEKVPVLAQALLRAVGRGHDNELFVLLADLLELDDHLEPLLAAVRVALARHHQVLLVCPWPPGLRLPEREPSELVSLARTAGPLLGLLGQATTARFHEAYQRLRRAFARLGVGVVCAAGEESVPLILDRLERLRQVGGKR